MFKKFTEKAPPTAKSADALPTLPEESTVERFFRFSLETDATLKRIQKYKNDQLSAFGLRSMHLMFLCCLDRAQDGLTPAELADRCGVDKAFISRITADLALRGYVSWRQDPGTDSDNPTHAPAHAGRPKRRLFLTSAGHDVMQSVLPKVEETVRRITDDIPPTQLEAFYDVLSKLNGNLTLLNGEA